MKIGVKAILRDHFATLRNAESGKTSYVDIFIFYFVPLAGSASAYFLEFSVSSQAYNVSITFFGIFLPLLLNIQVAIFTIFQRKWNEPSDARLAEMQRDVLSNRKQLLGELNANISYLTLVSCVGLTAVLIFYAQELLGGIAAAFSVFLYVHFLLTFLMIIKRAHALFQREYRD